MDSLPFSKIYNKKIEYTTQRNVKGKVRKFDQKLFDKYDVDARELTKRIFKDKIKDNPNEFGEDMIFVVDNFPYKYLELQVFSKWDSEKFPYDYPFVYSRKMKFSKDTLFVTFNKHMNEVIIFAREFINDKESRLKKYDRELINYVSWKHSTRMHVNVFTLNSIRRYAGESSDSDEPDINSIESDND